MSSTEIGIQTLESSFLAKTSTLGSQKDNNAVISHIVQMIASQLELH